MRIVLVRHGQAEPKKTWKGLDGDRPLVARGRRQAKDLSSIVGCRHPARVISSPAVRCRQTVEPASGEWGVPVEISAALSPDSGRAAADLVADLVSAGSGPIVICTHREVIVELLPHLAKDGTAGIHHRLPGAKGGVWDLRFRAGKLRGADYRPPAS